MNKKQELPWDNPRFKNWISVVQAEKAIVRALSKALQPFDLKLAQLDMLMNLYRHPGMSQHDLATQQGEDLLMEALKVYTELIDRVMAQSSPAQCDAMGEQMRRISEMLREE